MTDTPTPRTDALASRFIPIVADITSSNAQVIITHLFTEILTLATVLELELTAVNEQRDRLAEAMQEMWPFIEEDGYPACNTPSFNAAIKKYKEAIKHSEALLTKSTL